VIYDYKVTTELRTSVSDRPPNPVIHKTTKDDAENQRKKSRKKASTSDRVLNSRNDVAAKTGSSQAAKRKSDSLMAKPDDAEEDSGCSQAKKLSPTHTVSFCPASQDTVINFAFLCL